MPESHSCERKSTMAGRAVVCMDRYLSGGTRTGLAKLAESPLQMGRKIKLAFAIPAQMGLVEGRAIERRSQVTTSSIAAIGFSFRQFFPQGRHPSAEGAEKPPAEVGLLKHQAQHFLGLTGVVHLFLYDGKYGVFQCRKRLSVFRSFCKPLRDALAKMLHAEGEQFLFGVEITEKSAPGDPGVAADLFHCSPVKTDGGEQIPSGPFNLSKDELVLPLAKRPGILRFRPLFAAGRTKRFLHCMQIMAQSAVL